MRKFRRSKETPHSVADQEEMKVAPTEAVGKIAVAASAEPTDPDPKLAPIGFKYEESGLIVPEDGARIDVKRGEGQSEVVIIDKRRWTPQSLEAEDKVRREALSAPLTMEEISLASTIAGKTLVDRYKKESDPYHKDKQSEPQDVLDLRGDADAFYRLRQIANGEYIGQGNDQTNQYEGMSPRDRVRDLVKVYSGLTADIPHIGSMGGSVTIDPETREVHYGGYNNSLLYDFARLGQIMDKIESDPMKVRLALQDDQPDFTWLTNEPVTVSGQVSIAV